MKVMSVISSVEKINTGFRYHNILVKDGELWYCTDGDERLELAALSVGYLHKIRATGKDCRWCPLRAPPFTDDVEYVDNTHYLCDNEVPGHFGHTVFDSISSQYSTLRLCGIPMDKDTRITTIQRPTVNESHYHDIKSAYSLLFGEPVVYLDEFHRQYRGRAVILRTLVVGCSKKGVSFYTTNYVAHNGYIGAWAEFRNYCYLRSGAEGDRRCNVLFSTTVNNARDDRKLLNDGHICAVINSHPQGKIVDWNAVTTLKEQILLMFHTNIYISIDGTGGLNALFLPQNAIFINLGVQTIGVHGYMDDYVYPACDMRLIYYHDHLKYNSDAGFGIDLVYLTRMIMDPKKYLSHLNYSVYGLKLVAYLRTLSRKDAETLIFNFLITSLANACTMLNNGMINVSNAHKARDMDMTNPIDSYLYISMYLMFMKDIPGYVGETMKISLDLPL